MRKVPKGFESSYTVLTNAQRADLIDALEIAIEDRKTLISSNLLAGRKEDTPEDAADREVWTGEIKRFRPMRKFLLAEELAAISNRKGKK